MNEVQTLRQLLQKAADLRDLSGRGLADLATANGWNLNRSTVSKVLNGTYSSRPSSDTIRAVAWLAGVSERIAFEAAGQPVPGSSFADELPEEANLLAPRERKIIVDFIRVLIEHHQQPTGETDDQEDQEPRQEESGQELDGAGGKARKSGAPMIDDLQIRSIRSDALAKHYEWVREKALEHSARKALMDQARNTLTRRGAPGLDPDSVVEPEVDDQRYVQYLAWRQLLDQGAGDRSLMPLSANAEKAAARRWRREFAELVLLDTIRTQGISDGVREFVLQDVVSALDRVIIGGVEPVSTMTHFVDTATLTSPNQGQDPDYLAARDGYEPLESGATMPELPSTQEDTRQSDYALAQRKGETQERRRRRLEGEPWDHADPDGPETGA